MNRSQRTVAGRLPVTISPWEAALVDVGVSIEGEIVEGMFVLVEQSTGLARMAGPLVRGESLLHLVTRALTDPPRPCAPARPPKVLCADDALASRLESELRGLGIPVQRVGRVPAADHLLESLAAWMAPPEAPGIAVELDRWAATFETLCRLAPWRQLTDGVTFRFAGGVPELEEAVAVVLGAAGEQRGVALFSSATDHEKFHRAAIRGDVDGVMEVEAWNLYVDPVEEFSSEELERCRKLGLVVDGIWCPRVTGVVAGRVAAASERRQRVLMAAVEAIVGLCVASVVPLEVAGGERTVVTCLGPLKARATPAEVVLVTVEHGVTIGVLRGPDAKDMPALVIKMRKADAARLGRSLAAVDRLTFERAHDGWVARVAAGARVLGTLLVIPFDHGAGRPLGEATSALLCVSAGGPLRPRIRPSDFVYVKEVAVV